MGLFSFINLKKRKRITLLVVDLDKIIKGAGKKTSTIHLNIFPTETNEISSIFMEFTDNMHKQMWLIGKDFYFRLKQLLSGGSTPQMCRQPTADLFRRKFVIFSCHTQSMPAKNCLFPAQNLWLIARRQFMRCCPKRKKTPASNQWVMDTGASRMIYMISVMLLFFQRTQKSPAWTCIQTGLWNVILAGEGFGSKNNSKLRDDIYFVVKAWKSIPISEYLIFRGEKGWHSQRSTTKAPISRCFCSWHLFCPV